MTDAEQPGLRMRLAHEARRIASQHAHLDALESLMLRALERGDPAEVREALEAYRGSLDSHFALEEQVHFPALHGLRASLSPELERLVRDHGRFRAVLAGLGREAARMVPHDGAVLAASFRDLAAELKRHERREEDLLAQAAPSRA